VAKKFVHSWDPKILAKRLDDVKRQYLSLLPEKKKNHHTPLIEGRMSTTLTHKTNFLFLARNIWRN